VLVGQELATGPRPAWPAGRRRAWTARSWSCSSRWSAGRRSVPGWPLGPVPTVTRRRVRRWPAIDAGARLPERRGSAGRSLGVWIAVVCRRWRLYAWHTHPLPHW